MPVFGFFWQESFEARKKRHAARASRLAPRGSGLRLAGSQNSFPRRKLLLSPFRTMQVLESET